MPYAVYYDKTQRSVILRSCCDEETSEATNGVIPNVAVCLADGDPSSLIPLRSISRLRLMSVVRMTCS